MKGAGGVSVTGAGSPANPYLVSSDIELVVDDTATINLTLSGDGSPGNPYTLEGDATVTLDGLTDVVATGGATGYVLAKQADGTFALVPPTTAATGALTVGDGLQGDASGGNPIRVKLAPSSGLIVDGTGLRISGGGAWSTYTPTVTATTTNPALGNGSVQGWYSQTGKTVHVSVEYIFGSTTTRGVGSWSFSLPVAPATNRRQILAALLLRAGAVEHPGSAAIFGGKVDHIDIATSTAGNYYSHSVPATMPAGSIVSFTGTYEAA